MPPLPERFNNLLHLLIAVIAVWLVASSPWLGMVQWTREPGLLNTSHAALGIALLVLGAIYLYACTVGGRWRLYFPWLSRNTRQLGADVAGLVRGRRPGSEAGGLFASIEGLLLLALMASALTGMAWLFTESIDAAIAWRGHHVLAARAFVLLFLAHIIAVALHLLDFARG